MSEDSPFKLTRDGQIAWLVLDRPDKRNTMNAVFFRGLGQHFRALDQDGDVRVIVIRAEGKSFTAGLDLTEAGSLLTGTRADQREALRRTIAEFQESFNLIERCRKPVIAAIHGHCIGGGVNLICACDIRLAARDAVFSVRETRIGIVADIGVLQRLPHIVGSGWAAELALTGRDFSAREALNMGLITGLWDDRKQMWAAAGEMAAAIAALPPLAVQGVKDVLLYSRDNGVYPGLQYVAQKNAAALPSEDLFEAVAAFMEKRKPQFAGK
jgi:enoyl-CoA hydratase/carnithine racemase